MMVDIASFDVGLQGIVIRLAVGPISLDELADRLPR
jgi:hypothetical protein